MKRLKQGIDLDCSNHFILNIFHASKVLLTISLTTFPIHWRSGQYNTMKGMNKLIQVRQFTEGFTFTQVLHPDTKNLNQPQWGKKYEGSFWSNPCINGIWRRSREFWVGIVDMAYVWPGDGFGVSIVKSVTCKVVLVLKNFLTVIKGIYT